MGNCSSGGSKCRKQPGVIKLGNEDTNNELTFKLVLLGDLYVGKTSILWRLIQNDFLEDNYSPTIGVAYLQKKMNVGADNSTEVTLNLWDTGGHSYFKDFIRLYYRDANAALLIFDRTNAETFKSQKDWINEQEDKIDINETVVCIGANKSDLEDKIAVSDEEVKELMSGTNYLYFETSARTGYNVEDMFKQIAQECYSRKQKTIGQKVNEKK